MVEEALVSLLWLTSPRVHCYIANSKIPGNIRTGTVAATPDLTTPSIKSDVYTTGRGGQGNMSKNDPANPDRARASQDVKATPRRLSQGQSHYGRGMCRVVEPIEGPT